MTADPEQRPRPAPHAVRPVTKADVRELTAMLARTFDDDPVTNYIFPSARRRAPGLRTYFRLQIANDFLAHGGVLTTEDLTGAAVWGPPGKPILTGIRGLLSVVPVAPYVIGNLSKTLRELNRIQRMHPHDPHWYLATLGTHVDHQGTGVGSALMEPILARCDAEGIPAVSRVVQGAQRAVLPAPRLRGHPRAERARHPDRVAHVARAAPAEQSVGLSEARAASPRGGSPHR